MLRTEDGTRVFDADDVSALIALSHIELLLIQARIARLKRWSNLPVTERELHVLEHGHELAFGCCKPAESVAQRVAS